MYENNKLNIITSISNLQIKNLINLQKKSKERSLQEVFIIEGFKMFEEAKTEGIIHNVYLSEDFHNEFFANKENKDYFRDIRYNIISNKIFSQVSDTVTPQGVMAVVKQKKYKLDDIINQENPNIIILESIQDPGNLGTIIRTAEAAGTTGIIMNKGCVDVYNPKVIRSTMGSIYRVPFIYVDDLNNTIDRIKKLKITLYAAHLNGANDYHKENYKESTGFIIGNEAKGLNEETVKKADKLIKIPMNGKVESLNAAIASSILMYEVFRQRKTLSS